MEHNVYVYGTLRTGSGELVTTNGTMFDLGSFPGIRLGGSSTFVCEKVVVDRQTLNALDRFEGFDVNNHDRSLYIRRPFLDGWIYEYNSQNPLVHDNVVEGGDWLAYKGQTRGSNADYFFPEGVE